MGRRILSFGVAATHARITALSAFGDVVSISDFDAFALDPHVLRAGVNHEVLSRRQAEIRDLVQRKGGLLLCILRPPCQMQTTMGGVQDVLNLLDMANPQIVAIVKSGLRMGTATKWGLVGPRKGVTFGCVQSLGNRLRPEAFLELERGFSEGVGVLTVAENSAGWPVSFEFACGPGRLCFVPVPVDVKDSQLGAAVARMVEEHFGGSVEVELPEWVSGVSVPGAEANDARIAELEKQREEVAVELARLSEEKSRLLNFRVLLFGYGKSLLEPAVRQSLRELGFKVLEPEEYDGEWDVDLTDEGTGASAVGEVEGSEGAINVDKLRQLLEYVEAEENAGRKRKGILVGNGYRLKGLGDAERKEQFTEAAIRRARGFEYCLLPTSELFAAVSAVLKSPNDNGLKKHIRDSILSTVGPWKFTTLAETGGTASAGAD